MVIPNSLKRISTFLVCGYTGGCTKCTSMGFKLVVLSDNVTTCCTPNVATVGAEYINVYEKPSECPAWLEKAETNYLLIGKWFCVGLHHYA